MPLYRTADIDLALFVPLETLARAGRQLTDDELLVRVETAQHEAAHFLAACYCRASITRIEVTPTGRAKRTGAFGSASASEALEDEGALISLVGYAWEEQHGHPNCGASDLSHGTQLANQAGVSVEDLLTEARKFVRDGAPLIGYAAAGILGLAPKSGILRGRPLRKLVDVFWPSPRDARPRPQRKAQTAPESIDKIMAELGTLLNGKKLPD